MCKIILKFGDPITHEEMKDHRESCEKGAGMLWYSKSKGFQATKALDHEQMFKVYEGRDKSHSPFYLFHSRYPSEGPVTYGNIQPFMGQEIAYCHNGTMSAEKLRWACMGQRILFDGTESDSLLLFRLLKNLPLPSAITILKDLDQNFVLVSRKRKEVHIIGRFRFETSEKEADESKPRRVLQARNYYTGPVGHIVTDFEGNVKYEEVESAQARARIDHTPTRRYYAQEGELL